MYYSFLSTFKKNNINPSKRLYHVLENGSSVKVVGKYKNLDICIVKLYPNARFFYRYTEVVIT
jgi:hypothetical protein